MLRALESLRSVVWDQSEHEHTKKAACGIIYERGSAAWLLITFPWHTNMCIVLAFFLSRLIIIPWTISHRSGAQRSGGSDILRTVIPATGDAACRTKSANTYLRGELTREL